MTHSRPIRIMIVDDSLVARATLMQHLMNDPEIVITGSAGNGEEALRLMAHKPCDVVLLDVDMPHMDGIAALPHLRGMDPFVQILVISGISRYSANITLRALESGATDCLAKPSSFEDQREMTQFHTALIEKIHLCGAIAERKRAAATPTKILQKTTASLTLDPRPPSAPAVIAIAASTGGPQALFDLLRPLCGHVMQPIIINQHMPATFTPILAQHITQQTGIPCVEAHDGMTLEESMAYLAPGGKHLRVENDPKGAHFVLDFSEPVHYCRPSATVLFRSLASCFASHTLTIMLTGMGYDGFDGCADVHRAGGTVLAQDRDSSVVWGMPGSVAQAGMCHAVAAPAVLADHILRIARTA